MSRICKRSLLYILTPFACYASLGLAWPSPIRMYIIKWFLPGRGPTRPMDSFVSVLGVRPIPNRSLKVHTYPPTLYIPSSRARGKKIPIRRTLSRARSSTFPSPNYYLRRKKWSGQKNTPKNPALRNCVRGATINALASRLFV